MNNFRGVERLCLCLAVFQCYDSLSLIETIESNYQIRCCTEGCSKFLNESIVSVWRCFQCVDSVFVIASLH